MAGSVKTTPNLNLFYRLFCLALIAAVLSSTAHAGEEKFINTRQPEKIKLLAGKSMVLRSSRFIDRVNIPNEEIAGFMVLSENEIYLTGKAGGTTNLVLWQNKKIVKIYDIEVVFDVSGLKQRLHEVLPEETKLKVFASNNSITLSGRVSSAANLSRALEIANAYMPEKGKVINLADAGGIQQVMLEVRVAEMSRSIGKRLGINFAYVQGETFFLNMLGSLTFLDDELNDLTLRVSPSVNSIFRFTHGSSSWTGFVDALKEDGLIKILAEPTLITLSGEEAYFLAGGEFPVPVPQGLGTTAIEFKDFGVGLTFTPTVLNDGKINIRVAPEVSELDFTTAQIIGGFVVPGLNTRKAATVVEMADGQSFAIAGLLSESIRDGGAKFPLLGDIPILGALFRSREFQKRESELVIIVTPHLVKPLDITQQTLPTDYYIEPTDSEFFLEGLSEGRHRGGTEKTAGELEGNFGHALPGEGETHQTFTD